MYPTVLIPSSSNAVVASPNSNMATLDATNTYRRLRKTGVIRTMLEFRIQSISLFSVADVATEKGVCSRAGTKVSVILVHRAWDAGKGKVSWTLVRTEVFVLGWMMS